ncbi:MAG: endonuclease/exonuclease/phosphatase family protein [Halobacteriovoraceae bacterium]|nr:endonuclease/exonuclease/phosphatase family protein [Halobacteriovoraceae bacterium]
MKSLGFLILLITFSLSSFAGKKLKLTTYNVGLAHTFIPYAKERTKPLQNLLKNYETDVLCLQEVWKKKDRRKMKKALKKTYPHFTYSKVKNYRVGSIPTCKISDIFGEGKFVSCMQDQCGGKEGDDFTDCIINKCGDPLENLKNSNRTCASALMAQVGKSPVASILTLLNPLWRAGQFAYKGSDGLMLFSKYPIKQDLYIDMKTKSTLNRRGAIQATLDVSGEEVQVVCTHITADLSATVPYTGVYADWEEENEDQFYEILMAANRKVIPTALMGDFNCGFEDPVMNLGAELAGSCQQPLDWGYSDPLSEETRDCTFCADNLLNEGETTSVAIDHIYLKGMETLSSKVLFKDVISVETKDGKVKTQYSDHFGYEVTVEFPKY